VTRLPLRTRVAAASAILALLVLVGMSMFVHRELRTTLTDEALRQAHGDAARLAGFVDAGGGEQQGTAVAIDDPSLVTELARPDEVAVVVDGRGQVLQSSDGSPSVPAGFVATCLSERSATTVAHGLALGCSAVGPASRPAGATISGASLAPRDRVLSHMRTVIAVAVLAGFVLVLMLAWLMIRRALRPLGRIAETAREIGAGALERRIDHRGVSDEVGVLAEELNRSFERLERSLTEQAMFLADVSHELRSPLAAARGHAELLHGWAGADPIARSDALKGLQRSITRMSRLVDDLLHMAHGDSGPAYVRAAVALDEVLVEVHQETRALAPHAAVGLRIADAATVTGDRDKLYQLIRNLVDNSARHTPPGGEIGLELRRDSTHATVTVTDTGSGIDADELPHIFERRYRGRRDADHRGVGLGLAIAREIAEAHLGTIVVDSRPGRGTTMSVRLPLAGEQVLSDPHVPATDGSRAVATVSAREDPRRLGA
jgi:signal transduction histidine kinase